MEATTIYKQLNNVFEELYYLFDESIMNSELMNNPSLQKDIVEFMDNIRIESEWNMEDDEREEFEGMYFEAGHNDVDAVYYPFDPTKTEIDLVNIKRTLKIWQNTLECIKYYSIDNKFIEQANDLEQRIRNLQI